MQNVSTLVESWDGTSQKRLRCTRKPLEVHRLASVNAEFSDAVQLCGHGTTCGSGVAGRCWKAGSSSTYSESCFESAGDGRRNPFGRALYLSVLSDQGSAKRSEVWRRAAGNFDRTRIFWLLSGSGKDLGAQVATESWNWQHAVVILTCHRQHHEPARENVSAPMPLSDQTRANIRQAWRLQLQALAWTDMVEKFSIFGNFSPMNIRDRCVLVKKSGPQKFSGI